MEEIPENAGGKGAGVTDKPSIWGYLREIRPL